MQTQSVLNRIELIVAPLVALVWAVVIVDWVWIYYLPPLLQGVVLGTITSGCVLWVTWSSYRRGARNLGFWVVLTITFPVFWQYAIYGCNYFTLEILDGYLAWFGLGILFLGGLAWQIWGLEKIAQHLDFHRCQQREFNLQNVLQQQHSQATVKIWNPLDPEAWYYGRKAPRLNQSLSGFVSYSYLFLMVCLVLSQIRGCSQYYDFPAGGGEQKQVAQVVKIQKIIRKRFVVNPYSAILFDVPEIDEVKLELNEATAHQYKIGFGEGEGAGFAGGTSKGMVGFYRLEYSGGDWNQDFGVGGDMNMLIKYTELTSQKIAKRTKAVTPAQLDAFDGIRCPPLIYITGQGSISLGNNDVKILREYLLDKHGMLFGDNGGSKHFHNQFLAMMQKILPDVRPVRIPVDDKIHRIPFTIPRVPYVAPHGGTEALGWFKDGRWMCYYHPGDIGDAWANGHAGVSPEIWNMCYQLGVNIINYAHVEHAKWRLAQQKKKGGKK